TIWALLLDLADAALLHVSGDEPREGPAEIHRAFVNGLIEAQLEGGHRLMRRLEGHLEIMRNLKAPVVGVCVALSLSIGAHLGHRVDHRARNRLGIVQNHAVSAERIRSKRRIDETVDSLEITPR